MFLEVSCLHLNAKISSSLQISGLGTKQATSKEKRKFTWVLYDLESGELAEPLLTDGISLLGLVL